MVKVIFISFTFFFICLLFINCYSFPGELREDVPLRPNDSVGFSRKFGGIRLIIASFALLSIAVTVALATQIYYGDFEVSISKYNTTHFHGTVEYNTETS